MAGEAVTERSNFRNPAICPPGFTGRARELADLTDALAAPPGMVLVEGEAGIGKSRLILEFMSSPAGRQHRALVATCPPFRRPHTLGPVADALRQVVGDVPGLRLSALAGALVPLFPEWAGSLPPAPEPAEDATAARHRMSPGCCSPTASGATARASTAARPGRPPTPTRWRSTRKAGSPHTLTGSQLAVITDAYHSTPAIGRQADQAWAIPTALDQFFAVGSGWDFPGPRVTRDYYGPLSPSVLWSRSLFEIFGRPTQATMD
jgi:AAA ATPase-like protein